MRTVTLISAAAILSLTALSAHAQGAGGPAASDPASASSSTTLSPEAAASAAQDQTTRPAPTMRDRRTSDQAGEQKRGYNAKPKTPPVKPGFAQTTGQQQGNDSGNLVPYGPPR